MSPVSNQDLFNLCQRAIIPGILDPAFAAAGALNLARTEDLENCGLRSVIAFMASAQRIGWAECADKVKTFHHSLRAEQNLTRQAVHCIGLSVLVSRSLTEGETLDIMDAFAYQALQQTSLSLDFIDALAPAQKLEFLEKLFRSLAAAGNSVKFHNEANRAFIDRIFALWCQYLPLCQQLYPAFTIHPLNPGQLPPYVQLLLLFPASYWDQLPPEMLPEIKGWVEKYEHYFKLDYKDDFQDKQIGRHVNFRRDPDDNESYLFAFLREAGNIVCLGNRLNVWPKGMPHEEMIPHYLSYLTAAALDYVPGTDRYYPYADRFFCLRKLGLSGISFPVIVLKVIENLKSNTYNFSLTCTFLLSASHLRSFLRWESGHDNLSRLIDQTAEKIAEQTGIRRTWMPLELIEALAAAESVEKVELLKAISLGLPNLALLKQLKPTTQLNLSRALASLPPNEQQFLRFVSAHLPQPSAGPIARPLPSDPLRPLAAWRQLT